MLTAKRENGELISLVAQYSNRETLLNLRKKETFYCPQCSQKLILKLGQQKIFHFAHESSGACIEKYERESQYHLLGKLHLYKWLEEKGLSPIVEPYFKYCSQRADLAFSYQDKQYVIEYQCSTIPEDIFIKRNQSYLANDILPIWINGGKNIKRKKYNQVMLSNFDFLFLKNGSIPAYCSESAKFILLQGIYPISTRKAFTTITIKNLSQLSLQDFLQPNTPVSLNMRDWLTELRRMKGHILTGPQSRKNPLLKELYNLSLNISFLPPIIGLPLKNNILIETSPFIWQCYLYMDVFHNKKAESIVTFQQVYIAFLKRIKNNAITIRKSIDTSSKLIRELVYDYLELLTDISWLEQINDTTFKITKLFQKNSYLSDQLEQEDRFYKVNEGKILSRLKNSSQTKSLLMK